MITIIADEGQYKNGYEIYQALNAQGAQADYVPLDNVVVKPCVNCGGCTNKTYGSCVVRDDGDWIYPKIAKSEVLVLVTPVVFGSYSFKLKRVLDKLGLFMDRHYFLVNGELTKGGMPDRTFKCFAVGVTQNAAESDVFKKLFQELLTITRGEGKAFVTGTALSGETISDIVKEAARA
jgi:multimeric flavodoxin WrbA